MKFLVYLALMLVVLLAIGLALPADIVVQRTAVIAAPPQAIHPHLADLRTWPEWSAWNEQTDPAVEFEFSGAESGVGAEWRWSGEVFEPGYLEVTASDPQRGLGYVVHMDSGLTIVADISYTAEQGGTRLTWTDTTAFGMGPLGGWMKLLLGGMVDANVGGNQERSLAGLKRRVESAGRSMREWSDNN